MPLSPTDYNKIYAETVTSVSRFDDAVDSVIAKAARNNQKSFYIILPATFSEYQIVAERYRLLGWIVSFADRHDGSALRFSLPTK